MRLLIVTHYYPAHRGGIEAVAGQLARRLATRHAVEWFSSACDPAPPPLDGLRPRPVPTLNVIERRFGLPFPIWDPRIIPALYRACGKADVVHLHDVLYLGNLLIFAFAKTRRKPTVVTQHVGFIPYRNAALRMLLKVAYRVVGSLTLARADRVIFVSHTVRNYFRTRVRLPTHTVVPNGVDSEIFRPTTDQNRRALRDAIGLDQDRPVLLFVGRFVEKKGLLLLRALAERLRDVQWLFAGWGPLDPDQWGFGHVRVMRDRQGASLAEIYQAADLLLLPSVGEGFPLVVQEAMSCGTPALVGTETAMGLPGLESVLHHEPVGRDDDVAAWLTRVTRLIADRKQLIESRDRVAAVALGEWSWDRCVEAYETMFHELAAGRTTDREQLPGQSKKRKPA